MPRLYSSGLGGGGQGISIYNFLINIPAAAADGTIIYVLETRKIYSYNATKLKWVVVGGEGAMIGRVNQTSIPSSTQTIAITFSEAMPSSNYSLLTNIFNGTDANPIFLQVVGTIKSTTGFTVTFNAPTDSANYVLDWAVSADAPEEYP